MLHDDAARKAFGRGAAQDMLRYGEQLPAIMQAGRWQTSTMVARYTARQGAHSRAAARIAGCRSKERIAQATKCLTPSARSSVSERSFEQQTSATKKLPKSS